MGRVVHFEIHAENPDRAQKFYSDTFGWKFNKWDGPFEYYLIETGSRDRPGIDGGLMRRQDGIDGQAMIAFVCTLDVESLDDTIEKVNSNGGQTIVEKNAVPGVGWMAYFKDTEGNIFGAMQADPQAG